MWLNWLEHLLWTKRLWVRFLVKVQIQLQVWSVVRKQKEATDRYLSLFCPSYLSNSYKNMSLGEDFKKRCIFLIKCMGKYLNLEGKRGGGTFGKISVLFFQRKIILLLQKLFIWSSQTKQHINASNRSVKCKKRSLRKEKSVFQLLKNVIWAATEWVNAGWLAYSADLISPRDYLHAVLQRTVSTALLLTKDSRNSMKLYPVS